MTEPLWLIKLSFTGGNTELKHECKRYEGKEFQKIWRIGTKQQNKKNCFMFEKQKEKATGL